MLDALARTLVEKEIVKKSTEVIALYNAIDLSGQHRARVQGNFVILTVDAENLSFLVGSTVDGRRRRIVAEDIVMIDGMEPDRLAANYNIKPDGTFKTPGKRRGRKPKYLKEAEAAARAA